ncbi:MAG: 3-hydroxyacyl-CoA dehydrogenase family protein [Rhodocyclaceae bacterium]|nr:3-hydroxyacyl-CoA dehydrogenase family protein [Rhodocyclaceae bacterium]
MEARESNRIAVAVIGAGLMGHGIAQVFARAGHRVAITDPDRAVREASLEHIRRNLREEDVDPTPTLGNIRLAGGLEEAVAGADLVFEAVPEKLALKQQLFAAVALHAPRHAVLASNTSVIPITRIGEQLDPDARSRLLGTHWWNPPHLIPLVEVVRTTYTDPRVFDRAVAWLQQVGKNPVKVQQDVAGFIGNRLQHALWREAISLVEAGVCDAEAIDTVVKSSFGMRLAVLGPIENADLVGLELTRDVHRVMFPELNCDKSPAKLLDRLIDAGHTGMRAGRGLRTWTPEEAENVRRTLAGHLIGMKRRG